MFLISIRKETNPDEICKKIEEVGFEVQSRFAMGLSMEQIEKAADADLNIVTARCGLDAAQYMEKQYGIPYICGVPVGDGTVFERKLKDKLCTEMSGGELQMVLIARALTINPKMLVLDEPESNLDFRNQLIILETIRKLSKKRGISAIVNTHYPEHALKISDKALILNREGRNIFGHAEEVINEENMKQAFSVQVHINQFEYRGAGYRSVVPLYLV